MFRRASVVAAEGVWEGTSIPRNNEAGAKTWVRRIRAREVKQTR